MSDDADRFERALASLEGGYDIGERSAYTPSDIVLDRIG